MVSISVSEARDRLPETVERAQDDEVLLERYGKTVAILMSPQRYEALLALEEESDDIAALDAAMAEEGDNIPWEQVRVDLGWT